MTIPATDQFMTPRAAALALRSTADPARERTAWRGEPLLMVGALPGGFVEVDAAGERWFALESALEPWQGAEGIALPAAVDPAPTPPSGWESFPAAAAVDPAPTPLPAAAAGYAGWNRTAAPARNGNAGLLKLLFPAGALLMLLSPFLSWVNVNLLFFEYNGSLLDMARLAGQYEGLIEVLVLGVAALAGGVLRAAGAINRATARVWGAVAGGIGLVEFVYWFAKFQNLGAALSLVHLGPGFYLLAAGSVVVIAGALIDDGQGVGGRPRPRPYP